MIVETAQAVSGGRARLHMPREYLLLIEKPAGVRLACVQGLLWITQDGRLADYILKSGEEMSFARAGLVIVAGLRESCIRIIHAVREDSVIHVNDTERRIWWAAT